MTEEEIKKMIEEALHHADINYSRQDIRTEDLIKAVRAVVDLVDTQINRINELERKINR